MISYHNVPVSAGIYRITCTPNGKIYIGSAINLRVRCKNHFQELKNNTHENPKLQNAWNKHGSDAFLFEILELVLLPEMLTAREQYYFDTLNPFGSRGFNIAKIAGSSLGMKHTPESNEKNRQAHLGVKASQETREIMRSRMTGNKINLGRKHTPEQRQKIGDAQRGRKTPPEIVAKRRGLKHTHEARAKMSKSMMGNKNGLGKVPSPEKREKLRQSQLGKTIAPEIREKISAANTGRKHSPEVYASRKKTYILTDPSGVEYTTHGLRQFCAEHNLNNAHLTSVLKGRVKQHKGWKARYAESDID